MISRFKELPKGVLRLLIVLFIVYAFIVLSITGNMRINGEITFLFLMPAYWIAVRAILWVYDGFRHS